jgi:hypothetical protein
LKKLMTRCRELGKRYGLSPYTVKSRLRRGIPLSIPLILKSDSATAKARKAGLGVTTVWYRMRVHNCTVEEAIAMGPPDQGRSNRGVTDPNSIKAKALATGFKPSTLQRRVKDHDCTAEEAIAMGSVKVVRKKAGAARALRMMDKHLAWIVAKAEEIGVSDYVVHGRLKLNWSVEEIISAPTIHRADTKRKAAEAGLSYQMIWGRMKTHNCTVDEAIAMGPSLKNPNSISAKARAAGFAPNAIGMRMAAFKCTADEAIAMGPVRGGPDSSTVKAREAGMCPQTIRDRMKRHQCSADAAIAMGPPCFSPSILKR